MIRAGLGALLGVVAAVLGLVTMIDFASAQSMLLPLISIVLISTLGTLSVLLASTRLSSTDRSRKAMMAGMRGFILISSACAIIFFAASCARLYRIEEMMAIANAPESIRASLVARAQALASCCSRVGLCCLLPPTFAGLMSLSSVFGYADSRVSFGALLGGIQLVVIGGCYFWVSRSLASLVLVIG
jgi:hypothetical protein